MEDHVDPSVWFTDEPGVWEWKGPVIQESGCAYGKFFENKAARPASIHPSIDCRHRAMCLSATSFIFRIAMEKSTAGALQSIPLRKNFSGDAFTSAVYQREPAESYQWMLDYFHKILPDVPDKALRKFLK